jgi:hypothetical protein
VDDRGGKAVRLTTMARGITRSAENPETPGRHDAPNAVWFKPVMFGFMLVGLLWIIVYYLSQTSLPVPALGPWNIMVGFGIMFIGFLMTTRWR